MEGDIVNIDVTVILDGWHGDTSRMFFVGERIPLKARKLVDVTYEAMMRGIAVVRPGVHIGAIGDAIQRYAESHRFSVVRDFCGHGVGRVFHDAPSILHYGRPEDGPVLREGMFFTVEPMINAGRYEVKVLSDGWTAVTKDRSLSAQFEHTVGVTATGYEIFTISPAGLHRPPYDLSRLAENPRSRLGCEPHGAAGTAALGVDDGEPREAESLRLPVERAARCGWGERPAVDEPAEGSASAGRFERHLGAIQTTRRPADRRSSAHPHRHAACSSGAGIEPLQTRPADRRRPSQQRSAWRRLARWQARGRGGRRS